MNDITKAKHFLKATGSKLQHLESFALMLATAESKYRDVKRRQTSNTDAPGALDEKEIEAALEYGVLRYLKKHNQLPKDVARLFRSDITLTEKKQLGQSWANA